MFSLLSIVMVIQVVSALAIIVLVLLQQGKGADMGSAFGTGSAGSLFGASGAANFLSRMTKWAAVVFFVSTGALAWMGHRGNAATDSGLMQDFQNRSVPTAPGAVPPASNSVPGSVPGGAVQPDASVPAAPAAPAAPAPATSSVPAAPATPAPATAPAN